MDTSLSQTESPQIGPELPPQKRKRGRPRLSGESYQEAQRRKETALADLRQMEVAVRRGELLEKEGVRREWEDVLRMVRARVLATVSRIRARMPHLTAQDAQLVDEELRAALSELGEGRST